MVYKMEGIEARIAKHQQSLHEQHSCYFRSRHPEGGQRQSASRYQIPLDR